jgi:hypothetical protein
VNCRSFDEQVVRRDPKVAGLMDQFVCVRVVQANATDLTLFQFDFDLTFAVFFLNADRTVYGRFGSRSDNKEAARDISLDGFRAALEAALELHRGYPANRETLAGKQPRPVRFNTPDDYPSLKGKFQPKLDYEGKVVQSCMHCHQIREAERKWWRAQSPPVPAEVIHPWPMPNLIGLELDTATKATVRQVTPGSPVDRAGFKARDQLLSMEGQPVLSLADVQWVLHHAPAPAQLHATVLRGGRQRQLTLDLPASWRQTNDISWRATTWDLRRMLTGGMVLKDLPAAEREKAGIKAQELALLVHYLGEYGEHAVGKRAGFKKNDVIVAVDGKSDHLTESELMARLLQDKPPGTSLAVTLLRDAERLNIELPMQ